MNSKPGIIKGLHCNNSGADQTVQADLCLPNKNRFSWDMSQIHKYSNDRV